MKRPKGNIFFMVFLSFLLFSIAFAIRIYKVDSTPSGILIDEASIGYNAYSVLKTGREDEWGISYPLVFKAFGDQKLPLYVYLVVPFIKYFGLSALSVRLPSVLAGSLLPLVVFFLLLELGFKKRIGFFGGLITALSPWTIILSRFGYETNIGLLFFTSGILFSFISLRKKNVLVPILGGIFFGLTLYSYVAYRFITPFIVFSFLFVKNKKNTIITKTKLILMSSFLFTLFPLTSVFFAPQSTARFNQAGFSYSSGLKMEIDENRNYCSRSLPKIICYAVSNKLVFDARSYLYRFVDTFSPDYLFMTGESQEPSLNINNFGLFYVWFLPFYILGIFALISRFRNKHLNPIDVFVITGLFVAVTPCLLVGSPHKLRLSALFPFITIVILYGVSLFETFLKNKILKRIYFIIMYVTSFISVFFFLSLFLTIHVQKYETTYRTYVPKLMKYLKTYRPDTQIYIRSITEGIIYYAFVNKIEPSFYQKNIIRNLPDSIGFAHSSDLANIHIIEEDIFVLGCKLKKENANALYVSSENKKEIPNNAKKIIYSENGVDTLAIIYELNKINENDLHCIKTE